MAKAWREGPSKVAELACELGVWRSVDAREPEWDTAGQGAAGTCRRKQTVEVFVFFEQPPGDVGDADGIVVVGDGPEGLGFDAVSDSSEKEEFESRCFVGRGVHSPGEDG